MRDLLDNSLANQAEPLSEPSDLDKPNLFNALFDQYKLENYLSQERVTDVYSAYDVDENRKVAVEILLPHFASQKTYASRFLTKMRMVSQLRHPNIAHVLQVGIAPVNNRPYFAREQVAAYPLRERMQQLFQQEQPVNSVYALKLVRQLAEALALAERLDIFHYDLNPDNIMLQSDGTVVLQDLGIPRIDPSDAATIQFETQYWSPEQIQGKPLDARSHVYSLGVLLYELLAKTPPAASESLLSSVKGLPLSSGNSQLDKSRPDLTAETVRTVHRALRAAPWSRFQSCTELLAAIDDAIMAEEFSIRSGGQARTQGFNVPWLKVALPLGALLLVALIATMISRRSAADSVPPTSVPVVAAVSPTDDAAAVVVAATDTPEVLPTETAVSATAGLALLEPGEGRTISGQDSVSFSWTWPDEIQPGQQFLLYAYFNGNPFVLDSVNTPSGEMMYETAVPLTAFSYGTGLYQWEVVLQSAESRDALAQSEQRDIFVQFPATPTPDATETPLPTATFTPTPIPQVQVIFSSASLRTGPSVRYDVIRYLEAGDVVTVLAINETNGLWYNVLTQDGVLGWISIDVTEPIGSSDPIVVPTSAIIPPTPTATRTPTPSPTPLPTATASLTPVPSGGGGGGGGNPPPPTQPSQPPTLTPPPP